MIKTKISLLLFFLFVFSAVAFSQGGVTADGTLSNGGEIISAAGGNTHFSSINAGLIFSEPLKTLDYRLDAGILARFEPESDNIIFSNVSTSAFVGAPVSADIRTDVANLRQVAYRTSTGSAPNDYADYEVIWSSWGIGGGGILSSGTFSVVPSSFIAGTNFIEWYAQNTDGEIRTFTTAVIANVGVTASFIKPAAAEYAALRPEIEVFIETNRTFQLSDVQISLYKGDSAASGVLISSTLYVSSDHTQYSTNTIKFRYDGQHPLERDGTYTLQVKVTDSEPKIAVSEVMFHTVKNSGLYQFLPYPSPYNPNSGQPFKIKYAIGEDSKVDINIYDRAGKLVSRVVPSLNQIAGEYVVDWNARNYAGDSLANGAYICEIKAKGDKEERKYMSFIILRK
jgi:hypothetical protein